MKRPALATRTRGVLFLLLVVACAWAWQWGPLGQWVDFEALASWQSSFKSDPLAPYIIAGAYVLSAIIFFPITLLTAATIFTFGPIDGNIYSLTGWLLGASVGYAAGKLVGREWLLGWVGSRVDRLDREAGRNGLLAVLALRVVPLAPFTIVNLFIGASHVCFRDFILGSVLGRIPGLVALTLFEVQIKSWIGASATNKIAVMALLVLALSAHRWLSHHLSPAKPAMPHNPADLQR